MTLSSSELAHLATAIEHQLGLRVTDRLAAIADVVSRRAARHREATDAYLRRIDAGDPEELGALASEVSVGETYFFRHAEQCQAFGAVLEPGMRVLSAGCSTGEEPYTLAMIARERGTPATIHGFDWNPAALAHAAHGRYTRWAMRALPRELERSYFTAISGGKFQLAAELRTAVTLFEANLHADAAWTSGRWDVVFCRNVVMYFSDERMREAIERLTRALAPGGYLFLGHAETLIGRAPGELELCHAHNAFYYRKLGRTSSRVDWPSGIAESAARVRSLIGEALEPAAPPAASPLDAIRALIAVERYGEARDALAALPADVGGSGDARLLDAVALVQTGKLGDAEAACGELLARGEHRAAALYLSSVCRASADDARAALEIDPTFAMASVQLAFLAKQRGDRDAYGAELARALALLDAEADERLALFAGGFRKATLIELCRTELARIRP